MEEEGPGSSPVTAQGPVTALGPVGLDSQPLWSLSGAPKPLMSWANRLLREEAWGLAAPITVLPVLLFQGEVTIHYNKLQADPRQGMSLDIGKLGQSSGV